MRRAAAVALGLAALTSAPSFAQSEIALKAGESAGLHSVYWIANCRSMLRDFGTVDILEGPPGLEITVRKADVMATRQNCPDRVPGGILTLTAKTVEANWSGVVTYRVNYKTTDGDKQSTHRQRVSLFAK